jgi:hypothetical protein
VRSATPGSTDLRSGRQTLRHKAQASRSQHSYSGSVHHQSDAGSDHGPFGRHSPPPVPPMPDTLYGVVAYNDNAEVVDDDRVEPDPRTPAEYALHAVFIRFASAAETKIDTFLKQSLVRRHLPIRTQGSVMLRSALSPMRSDVVLHMLTGVCISGHRAAIEGLLRSEH